MLFDVLGLGEALIDLTSPGKSSRGNDLFEANPAGGVANFLAMAAALGKRCTFVGKVGEDLFGRALEKAMREAGIDTRGMRFDREHRTSLAIVKNHPDGEREFSFFRNPGADMFLEEAELEPKLLASTRAFHYSSLSLTNEPARQATKRAVCIARQAGAMLSFDPNYRAELWASQEEARREIWFGVENCDVLKIALDELEFLTGQAGERAAMDRLHPRCGAKLITVTDGKNGAAAYLGGKRLHTSAAVRADTVDCTGAGDAFAAQILSQVLDCGLENLTPGAVEKMIKSAAEAAALVTTCYGSFRVMAGAVRA